MENFIVHFSTIVEFCPYAIEGGVANAYTLDESVNLIELPEYSPNQRTFWEFWLYGGVQDIHQYIKSNGTEFIIYIYIFIHWLNMLSVFVHSFR